jgi:hypothetical protein
MTKRILYVCSQCANHCSEACGHYDRRELVVMPFGEWLCESCFDDWTCWRTDDDGDKLLWSSFEHPPEYVPADSIRKGE